MEEDEEEREQCPNCGSRNTAYVKTHHGYHDQPGTSYGCDFSVAEYLCNACGERFAD